MKKCALLKFICRGMARSVSKFKMYIIRRQQLSITILHNNSWVARFSSCFTHVLAMTLCGVRINNMNYCFVYCASERGMFQWLRILIFNVLCWCHAYKHVRNNPWSLIGKFFLPRSLSLSWEAISIWFMFHKKIFSSTFFMYLNEILILMY